jgi:hypothetical protein
VIDRRRDCALQAKRRYCGSGIAARQRAPELAALLLSQNELHDCFGKPDHKVFQSDVLFLKTFMDPICILFKLIERWAAIFP